ncbi:MAG: hypothetical protein AB4062_09045 [Crocosphaera sp.]
MTRKVSQPINLLLWVLLELSSKFEGNDGDIGINFNPHPSTPLNGFMRRISQLTGPVNLNFVTVSGVIRTLPNHNNRSKRVLINIGFNAIAIDMNSGWFRSNGSVSSVVKV